MAGEARESQTRTLEGDPSAPLRTSGMTKQETANPRVHTQRRCGRPGYCRFWHHSLTSPG
jgi:hypothetical protein